MLQPTKVEFAFRGVPEQQSQTIGRCFGWPAGDTVPHLAPLILAIESTCDETAAALIDGSLRVLGECVASQDRLHHEFRGVVPEIAARAHVERILPVLETVFRTSGCELADLDAIAVATTPGLANSLLVGLMTAKTLALVLDRPLIAINHLHAHVHACRFDESETGGEGGLREIYPCTGLVVSGGHSHLFAYESAINCRLLGGTIDDAAGEAFDKVASMLRLGYPGGPAVSQAAESGNPRRYAFPRSYLDVPEIRFSFSGLKTAVRYAIAGPGPVDFASLNLDPVTVSDVAASFEQAVVDVLVAKSLQAVAMTGYSRLCVGGGVAANRRLRSELAKACAQAGIQLFCAPPRLCTDNAVMGAIAIDRYRAGMFESPDLDIQPGLLRG